jgi:hypothetical protein
MTDSMVSAGHYNALKLERDRWFAATHNLTDTLSVVRDFLASLPIDALGSGSSPDCGKWSRRDEVIDTISSALRKTPAQSLLIHDAELMEIEAKAWLRDGNATSMYSGRNVNCVLSARARELRNEAEGKG